MSKELKLKPICGDCGGVIATKYYQKGYEDFTVIYCMKCKREEIISCDEVDD